MCVGKIIEIIRVDRKKGIELLYENCYRKLFSIAFTFAKNKNDAEDIVQNVLLKLLTVKEEVLPVTNEEFWLYKVTKNTAMDFIKNNKEFADSDYLESLQIANKTIDEFVDMQNFESLIKNLDEKRKTILKLKILGEYTHKEISQILGVPIGTVQWLYNTAIKETRSYLLSLLSGMVLSLIGLLTSTIMAFEKLSKINSNRPGVASVVSLKDLKIAVFLFFVFIILFIVTSFVFRIKLKKE